MKPCRYSEVQISGGKLPKDLHGDPGASGFAGLHRPAPALGWRDGWNSTMGTKGLGDLGMSLWNQGFWNFNARLHTIHIHSRLRIQCLVNNVVDMLIPADLWLSCDPSPVSISVPLGSPKSPKRLGIAVVSQHLAAADCEFHPLWWNVKTSGMTCVENGHEKSVQGGAPMCPLVMIRCYKML